MHDRAGKRATAEDLIDVAALLRAFTEVVPDPAQPEQRVVFGTSGHRGTSLNGSFTETHIAAMSLAIAEYRREQGITGPLFIGADTHPLSAPAERVAREVLVAAGVEVRASAGGQYVPTPALSHAIIRHNRELSATGRVAGGADTAGSTDTSPDGGSPAGRADGIIVTPSHNPPGDGGFKYNPPHGGPADSDATAWIAARANELIEQGAEIARVSDPEVEEFDFLTAYVDALADIIDVEAIRSSGVRIGAHPLGGAAVAYWAAIRDRYDLDLTVLGPGVDPQWPFMTLDWDGKIRMDPSSAHVMAVVEPYRADFDVIVANDADADRFGVVTREGGLMQPNHVLAVAIDYLLAHRWTPQSGRTAAEVGKTLVSSSMIDRVVASHGKRVVEVPVGFKWFVPGLSQGELIFGGEESAGASFLDFDERPWTTDKDGMLLCLLAAEIMAVTGEAPDARYRELAERFGEPAYARIDAPATPGEKAALARLTPEAVTDTELAGDPITAILTTAPGNGASIGGLKVQSDHAWFAVRPSGTEDVMKIYAESFRGPEHLAEVQEAAKEIVAAALG